MERSFDEMRARCVAAGLDLIGVARIADYDARVPPALALAPHAPAARSAVVVGSAGRRFWDVFRAAPPPGPDPLDAFTRRLLEATLGPLAPDERLVFPFVGATPPASFAHLAECAGLGRPSLLGVLVHPTYGPWIALRAALLVRDDLVAPRPADGFDPCATCADRPCIAACPAGAIGPAGWDVPRCADHRLRPVDACADGCHARLACPWGAAYRHPPEARAFHQAAARRGMAALRAARG